MMDWVARRSFEMGGLVRQISRRQPGCRSAVLQAMPVAAETFTAGLPVEIGQIERELKKLWDASNEVMTRASLINLAVYSEATGFVRQKHRHHFPS